MRSAPRSRCSLVLLVGLLAFIGTADAEVGELRAFEPRVIAPYDEAQIDPDVARLADGRFIVVLTEGIWPGGVGMPPPIDGRDGSGSAVVAALLDRDGRPIGEPFVVNQRTAGDQRDPRVAADPTTGGFQVTWLDGRRAVLRRFSASGAPTSDEILLDPTGGFAWHAPTIGIGHAGRTWVAWQTSPPDWQLRLVSVSPTGDISAPTVVLDADTSTAPPLIVELEHGVFVTWSNGEGSFGRRVDADGTPDGPPVFFDRAFLIDAAWPTLDPPSGHLTGLFQARPGAPFVATIDLATGAVLDPIALEGDQPLALTRLADDCLAASTLDTTSSHAEVHRLTSGSIDRRISIDVTGVDLARFDGHADRLLAVHTNFDYQISGTVVAIDTPSLRLGADERFRVEVAWRDFDGVEGSGVAVPLAEDTGAFWFFDPANIEVTVKVLDGRVLNGHFWVFNGSLTNVEYTLKVIDTMTDAIYTFTNPLGQFGSFGDTEALPGP